MDFADFVLAVPTADLADAAAATPEADCVEFRMDLASDPNAALAAYDGPLPVLATNRAAAEGGEATGPDRIDALVEATTISAVEAIDLELAAIENGTAAPALEAAAAHDVAVVASVHDFDGTPEREVMLDRLHRAASVADVGKLAVTATDRSDALDLLAVTHEATAAGLTVATMAMGAAGRHTRAVAPLYGSKIGYAPVDSAAATAPGQFDLATLAGLVDTLQEDGKREN